MAESLREIQTVAIIPAFEEENRVGSVLRASLNAQLVDAVVVVDDGSTDGTCNSVQAVIEAKQLPSKPTRLVVNDQNRGKTESLCIGVDVAKRLGGTSLRTLVLLDADSSPIWSRDTASNMKLWQRAINSVPGTSQEPLQPEVVDGREDVFVALLARYIDEIIQPVADGQEVMRAGMYHRNTVVDTLLSAVGWLGHAGNRAVPVEIWDSLFHSLQEHEVQLDRWEIEGALNSYTRSLGGKQGSFMMHGVVNVGSRVKTGSILSGMKRMGFVHGQALRGAKKMHSLEHAK